MSQPFLMLVNGTSLCSGRLEVKTNQSTQRWSSVCEDDFDQQDAKVVCRELGCGAPSILQGALYGEVEAPMGTKEFQCGGHESSLLDYSVRLVNGTSLCSGRLEVNTNQSTQRWSSVCEADFDQQDAEVVCREHGCGPPSVLQGALYGEVEPPMRTKEFQCGGHESGLLDCRSSGSDRNTCSPGKAVGLTCSEPDAVRLVGGASRCAGTLELKHQGEWRAVTYHHTGWNRKTSAAACRELGCGSAVFVGKRYESSQRPVWEINSFCVRSGYALRECATSYYSAFILTLTCSESYTVKAQRGGKGAGCCSVQLLMMVAERRDLEGIPPQSPLSLVMCPKGQAD
ncbi:CD5 antigen-like [Perca fluviatilis]|uniref:CD5 antigen-like n=1 Tax=Perca fluviatilis TaxID=8168 RepID=UPI001963A054|nr:CD5 antigen-like [Perca fluviatilis]